MTRLHGGSKADRSEPNAGDPRRLARGEGAPYLGDHGRSPRTPLWGLTLDPRTLGEGPPERRREVAEALARSGDPRALDLLKDALDDPDSGVRLHAAAGVWSLAEAPSLRRRAEAVLQAGAEDPDPAVRCLALDRMGLGVGAPEGVLARVRVALEDPETEVRRRAVLTAHERALTPLAPDLLPCLDDGAASVREVAADALGFLHAFVGRRPEEGVAAVVAGLLATLEDEDTAVRHAAIRALGTLGAPAALPALEAWAASEEEVAAVLARQSLGLLDLDGPPPAPQPAERALALRQGAEGEAIALVDAGPKALPELARLLQEEGPRRAVLAVLAERGAAPLILELARVARDPPTPEEAILAGQALARSGPDAVPALLEVLDRGPPNLRSALVEALPPSPEGLAVLVRALEDPHPTPRSRAARAVARWGALGGALQPVLEGLQQDPEPEVQRAAREALRALGG